MQSKGFRVAAVLLLVGVLLAVMLVACKEPSRPPDVGPEASMVSRFTHVVAKRLTIENDALMQEDLTISEDLIVGDGTPDVTQDGEDAYIEGTLEVDGAVQFDGSVSATSDLLVDDTFSIDDTDSVITGAQTLVPTATFYQFSPVSVLTLTISTTGAVDGDFLILHNLVATTTTIVDTGATVGGGAITLAQDDLALFIFGDGVWIEIASPDNS